MMLSQPDRSERRPYLYAVFAWLFTGAWVLALLWTWMNYERWPLWGKIAAGLGLVLTTPAGSDLFLLFRLERSARKHKAGSDQH
jgi:hypothetical protein